jgi:hypothetical protein
MTPCWLQEGVAAQEGMTATLAEMHRQAKADRAIAMDQAKEDRAATAGLKQAPMVAAPELDSVAPDIHLTTVKRHH